MRVYAVVHFPENGPHRILRSRSGDAIFEKRASASRCLGQFKQYFTKGRLEIVEFENEAL